MKVISDRKQTSNRRVAMLAGLLCLFACSPELAPAQRYPGAWQEEPYPALYRAMLMHNVRHCGFLAYKAAYDNEKHPDLPEFLVYCFDTKDMSAYTVFLRPAENDDAVNGPFALYADIPPPTYWKK